MEWSLLFVGVCLDLIIWSQVFIVDRSPAIILDALVPALMLVLLRLIIFHIDALFLCFLFDLHIVSRRKGVDVDNGGVDEDFVVDERRELQATEAEAHVGL